MKDIILKRIIDCDRGWGVMRNTLLESLLVLACLWWNKWMRMMMSMRTTLMMMMMSTKSTLTVISVKRASATTKNGAAFAEFAGSQNHLETFDHWDHDCFSALFSSMETLKGIFELLNCHHNWSTSMPNNTLISNCIVTWLWTLHLISYICANYILHGFANAYLLLCIYFRWTNQPTLK